MTWGGKSVKWLLKAISFMDITCITVADRNFMEDKFE